MTVSTATYELTNDASITFVTATGTLAEVMAELADASVSGATIEHMSDLLSMGYVGSSASFTAVWKVSKKHPW